MHTLVCLQVTQLTETLATLFTDKGLFSRMDALVSIKVTSETETLAALITPKRLTREGFFPV